MSLYAKLALSLVALLTLVGVVYALLSVSATRHYVAEVNQTLNRDLARNLVSERNLVEEGRLNEAAVKKTFEDYMTINPSIEIYLLDLGGNILSFSADPAKVVRDRVALEPIETFLADDDGYVLGDDPRSLDRRKAFSVTPVPSVESPEGYLYVVLRGERYDLADQMAAGRYFLTLSGWAVAGSLVFAMVVGLAVFHLLTRRLHRLTDVMNRFRQTDFAHHESYRSGNGSGGDEIEVLGATFDDMAQRITAQIAAIEDQDAIRRELVAQVSHDLRTPLAALHGYLESLKLKSVELGPAGRAEHIDIALRHSERLRVLVADLFELATLDAKETRPENEPLALPDLVQDVALKFGLRAEEAGTSLRAEVDPGIPLVRGDIALLERVLENLIDNALNHTSPGGDVTIPVQRRGSSVRIAVSDTGRGIAPDDVGRIFDRFYRAGDDHRGGGHAGLGLAIAKRIVNLHGAKLEVESELGRGTTFAFELPVDAPAMM